MSKFFGLILSSWRRSCNIIPSKILSDISNFSKKEPQCKRWDKMKHLGHMKLLLAVVPLLFSSEERKAYKSTYEVEKEITDMVVKSEEMIVKGDTAGARKMLLEALKVAESTNVYGNISSVYDLLVTIALQEGGITEAEDLLANFIDKLLQLGYPEDHNIVVNFKLKLARVYQIIGNRPMAELGYRDCIAAQEKKLSKMEKSDETTLLIYVNSLFWYAKLLIENDDYQKANKYMVLTLKKMQDCPLISPSQVMVVLYHNAEIATVLKEYDRALDYLYKALDLCNSKDNQNPDLPLYVLKIGEIFLLKGVLENAEFWCTSAGKLSTGLRHDDALKGSSECLKKIEEMRTRSKLKKTSAFR